MLYGFLCFMYSGPHFSTKNKYAISTDNGVIGSVIKNQWFVRLS